MRLLRATAVCLLLSGLPGFAQTQVAYWDLNGTLARSAGSSGTMSASLMVLGPGFIGYGTGTAVNLQSGFTAGSSLRFSDLVSVHEIGRLTLTGLNFSGLETPTLTFAIRSVPGFTLSDGLQLEYSTDGGSWLAVTSLTRPTATYSLASYTFGAGILDNVANAGLRLTFSTPSTVIDSVEIDNVRVTAVPEPATFGLLAGLVTLAIALHRRRRTS